MKNTTYIQLSEMANPSNKFTFPVNPEKIQGSLGAKYQSFDIISKGTVKVPKGTEVSTIKWDGTFFGIAKMGETIVHKDYYSLPNNCIATLNKWRENGTALNLIVTGTWINVDVTISSFSPEVYGAYGNVDYSIEFVEKKDLKIYTTNELKIASFVKKVKPRNDTAQPSGSSYTIVSGDTLWGIASKKLGGGANWTKIYDANSSTIEEAANSHGKSSSDHGHWIWPGTVLTIPE